MADDETDIERASRGFWQPVAPPVNPPGSPLVWLGLAYLYYYLATDFDVLVEAAVLAVPVYLLVGRYLAGYAETRLQNEDLPASERTLVLGTATAVGMLSVGVAGTYMLEVQRLGPTLPAVVRNGPPTVLGVGTLTCWVFFDGLLARDWMYNDGVEVPFAWETAAVLPLLVFVLLSQDPSLRRPWLLLVPVWTTAVVGAYLVRRSENRWLSRNANLDDIDAAAIPFGTSPAHEGRWVLKRLADRWSVPDDVATATVTGVATERVRTDRHRRFEVSEKVVTREEPDHGFEERGLRAAYDAPDASQRDTVVPDRHKRSQIAFPKADTERTELCDDCDGTGTEACGCGNGWATCDGCGGNGRHPAAPRKCPRCGGAGERPCSNCDGSGQVACTRCDGYAMVRKLDVVRRYYAPVTERLAAPEWAPEAVVTAAEGRTVAAADRPAGRSTADGSGVQYDSEPRVVTVTAVRYEYDGEAYVCLAADDEEVFAPSAPQSRLRRLLAVLAFVAVAAGGVAALVGWLSYPSGIPFDTWYSVICLKYIRLPPIVRDVTMSPTDTRRATFESTRANSPGPHRPLREVGH